jgi:hypothetical protein
MKPFHLGMLALLLLVPLATLGMARVSTRAAAAGARENPLLTLIQSERARAPIAGRVEEQIAAGPYTYLAVRGARERVWVVTLGRGAAPGSDVRVRSLGRQSNFYSRRLQRTFPELAFGFVYDARSSARQTTRREK